MQGSILGSSNAFRQMQHSVKSFNCFSTSLMPISFAAIVDDGLLSLSLSFLGEENVRPIDLSSRGIYMNLGHNRARPIEQRSYNNFFSFEASVRNLLSSAIHHPDINPLKIFL